MMIAPKENARTGVNGTGGSLPKILCNPNFSASLDSRQAAVHAEMAAITAHVEGGLSLISQARTASAASISTGGKFHWRTVAEDEANRLCALLRMRHPGPPLPGKPVPPTGAEIRNALAAYQAIGRATLDVIKAETAVDAALANEDPTWEAKMMDLSRAESRLAELRRTYPHG